VLLLAVGTMSDTDDNAVDAADAVRGINPTKDQIKQLIATTKAIQAVYEEKSGGGELNRALNCLNRAWMDVVGLPERTFPGLCQSINRRAGSNKRKPMDDRSNAPLESASKRGTAAEGEKEDESEEEDDDGSRMEEDEESKDDRQTVLAARAFLLELRSDNKYDSNYAIVPLPSIIGMTDANIDYIFLEEDYDDPVVDNTLQVIKGILSVHCLGMSKAKLFRPTASSSEKTWEPIVGGTIGCLACNLELVLPEKHESN